MKQHFPESRFWKQIFGYSRATRARRLLYTLVCTICILAIASLFFANYFHSGKPGKPNNQGTQGQPTATAGQTPTRTVNVDTNPALHAIEVDILNNIKTYGFDNDPSVNNGLGGLWINWRYGTNPLQVDVNGTGETDEASGNALRHDPLTDLRYIHNLWSYKIQNPNDHQFDSEIARYTPIIKYEFANSQNERGWLFDELIALYNLSQDTFYKDTALSLARSYVKNFHSDVGSIYKINSDHPQGSYRVDLVLESGCALIQAGTLFNNQEWVQKGTSIVNFVYTHAYIPQYHTFPNQMDQVHSPDGSVNPQEPFYYDDTRQHYAVNGRQMQMGNISQIIISLLHVFQLTHNQDFLNKATDLLDPLSLPGNALGMWDTTHGGYHFSASFTGNVPAQPGSVTISKTRKEAGRQVLILAAFHLANQLANQRYQNMEARMLNVATQDVYIPSLHGSIYLTNPDWTPPTFKNGTLNNMVTTEAMGAELESLFVVQS